MIPPGNEVLEVCLFFPWDLHRERSLTTKLFGVGLTAVHPLLLKSSHFKPPTKHPLVQRGTAQIPIVAIPMVARTQWTQ